MESWCMLVMIALKVKSTCQNESEHFMSQERFVYVLTNQFQLSNLPVKFTFQIYLSELLDRYIYLFYLFVKFSELPVLFIG